MIKIHIVCVCCGGFIEWAEPIHLLKKKQIPSQRHRISVKEYEKYYEIRLNPDLVHQYQVYDEELHGILLSPIKLWYCEVRHVRGFVQPESTALHVYA